MNGLAKSLEGARVYLYRVSHDLRRLRQNKIFYENRKDEIGTLTTIILSCCLLWQTIYNAYEVRHHPKVGMASKSTTITHYPPLLLVDEMLWEKGWKNKEIRRMSQDVIFRYHLSFYRGDRALMSNDIVMPGQAQSRLVCL